MDTGDPVTMAKKKRQLTQAEIWDDSALQQSWDAAVEEYKVVAPSALTESSTDCNYSFTIASTLEVNVSKT